MEVGCQRLADAGGWGVAKELMLGPFQIQQVLRAEVVGLGSVWSGAGEPRRPALRESRKEASAPLSSSDRLLG